MPPEVFKYLEDIKLSIERIEFHIKDIRSLREFSSSWTVYDAVERRLAIIGEAVWQIDKIDKNILLTNKRKIIGFRHILTHDYDLVSPDIIWKILENNLPVLKTEISILLNNQ
jgi:uncharacterized protein with HEPN domain